MTPIRARNVMRAQRAREDREDVWEVVPVGSGLLYESPDCLGRAVVVEAVE